MNNFSSTEFTVVSWPVYYDIFCAFFFTTYIFCVIMALIGYGIVFTFFMIRVRLGMALCSHFSWSEWGYDADKQTVVTGMKTSTWVLHCVHIFHAQTQSKVIMLMNILLCWQVSRPPPGCHHCCIFRHWPWLPYHVGDFRFSSDVVCFWWLCCRQENTVNGFVSLYRHHLSKKFWYNLWLFTLAQGGIESYVSIF